MTSAKQTEPHWSRRDVQIHRPELQTRKEIPNGFMVRDSSLGKHRAGIVADALTHVALTGQNPLRNELFLYPGVITNGTVPERWRDQRVLGAARQDWDGKAHPLETDLRVSGPHPELTKGHTALHEANRQECIHIYARKTSYSY